MKACFIFPSQQFCSGLHVLSCASMCADMKQKLPAPVGPCKEITFSYVLSPRRESSQDNIQKVAPLQIEQFV